MLQIATTTCKRLSCTKFYLQKLAKAGLKCKNYFDIFCKLMLLQLSVEVLVAFPRLTRLWKIGITKVGWYWSRSV